MNDQTSRPLGSRLGYGFLAGLVLLHIALAITYANITPYRTGGWLFYGRTHPRHEDYVSDIGAPDERQHANYVIHLLEGKGLPVNRVMVPDPGHPGQVVRNPAASEEYEFLQAPLYYWLDAWFGRLVGIRDTRYGIRDTGFGMGDTRSGIRDSGSGMGGAGSGLSASGSRDSDRDGSGVSASGSRLSGAVSDGGYGGSGGAFDPEIGKRLRYLNAFFGAGTVLGVYFLGLWGVRRRDVAFLAAAIAGLLPMNLALSGSVSNDPLLFCICTWVMALLAKGVREGWDWETRVPIAILVGLGLLTKTTALDLIPAVLFAFVLRRPRLGRAVSSAVITVLIALPLWVRNQRLYGDPLGLKAFQAQFAGAIKAQDMMAVNGVLNHWFNYVGWYTVRSFFGVFGYMDVFLNERGNSYTGPADFAGPAAPNTLYRVLFFLVVLGAFGFLLYLFGGSRLSASGSRDGTGVGNSELGARNPSEGDAGYSGIPSSELRVPSSEVVPEPPSPTPSPSAARTIGTRGRGSGVSPGERSVHLLNAVFLAVVTLLFISYNMKLFQGQARYLFPAIGPISLGLAIGALYWAKSRRRVVIGMIVALLVGLNVYALVRVPGEFAKRVNPNLVSMRDGGISRRGAEVAEVRRGMTGIGFRVSYPPLRSSATSAPLRELPFPGLKTLGERTSYLVS